jgi:RNA polymerase sigma-70 factor, ECF subfamily
MEPIRVAEYIPRLRRYARALTGNRDAGDDLVQDTVERALNKGHLWRPDSDMRAWMFSIMHNAYLNQRRSPMPEDELDPEELPDVMVEATPFDRNQIAEVDKALYRISTEQREVLLLVAVEQMSYEETAKALAVPIGTVMSRLSRAREKLRHLMGGARPN